jgi:hypothetical protein
VLVQARNILSGLKIQSLGKSNKPRQGNLISSIEENKKALNTVQGL